MTALLSTPNSFASSYTRTFATALPLLGPAQCRASQPVRGSACSVRRQPLLFIAACSSRAHRNLSLSSQHFPQYALASVRTSRRSFRPPLILAVLALMVQVLAAQVLADQPGSLPPDMSPGSTPAPGYSASQVLSKPGREGSSRQAQRPRERPAALGSLQAFLTGMQVRTPARQPRRDIRNYAIPYCRQAKQVRLSRANSASHTRPGW
jgi:hypothetical protein